MAVYEITTKLGAVIEVEAPDNATQEQIFALANQKQQQQEQQRSANLTAQIDVAYPERKPESTFMGNIGSGFGAGMVGVGETAALGAAALLEEEDELAARDKIKRAADYLRPSGGDPDAITYKLAQGIGSIAGIAAPAALVAAAPVAGAGLAATGVGGALAIGAGAGEASERARAAGATEEERNAATRRGAVIGSLDLLAPARVFKAIKLPLIDDMIKKLGPETVKGIKRRLYNAGVTGGIEGAQEAATAILQNLNERGYNLEQKVLEGAGEEGLVGGGAGALLQLFVDALPGRARTKAAPPPEEEPGIAGLLPSPAIAGDAPTTYARDKIAEIVKTEGGISPEAMQQIAEETKVPFVTLGKIAEEEIASLPGGQEVDGEWVAGPTAGAVENAPELAEFERQIDEAVAKTKTRQIDKADPEQRMRTETEPLKIGYDPNVGILESEMQTIPQEEQAAQAKAREREALRALERNDTAAFEQPELFALEREQDRRRLGDEPTPTQAEAPADATPTTPTTPTQRKPDLVDLIAELEQKDISDAEATRFANIRKRIAEGKETAADREYAQRVDTELGLREMQAAVAPSERRLKAQAAPEQLSFRGQLRQPKNKLGSRPETQDLTPLPLPGEASGVPTPKTAKAEGLSATESQAVATPDTTPEAGPITAAQLDDLGVLPAAPMRKVIVGKDKSDPVVQEKLTAYAKNPKVSKEVRENVEQFVAGMPKARPDVLTPPKQQTQKGTEDVKPSKPKSGGRGAGISDTTRGVGSGRGSSDAGRTGRTEGVEGKGLARSGDSSAGAPVRKGSEPDTLTAEPKSTRRNVMPTLTLGATTKTDKGSLEAKGTRYVATRATTPVAKVALRTPKEESRTRVDQEIASRWEQNSPEIKEVSRETAAANRGADPLTVEDVKKVLKVLSAKGLANKKLTPELGAQRYFSKFKRPIDALYMALFDVVDGTPAARGVEGGSFYAGMGGKSARLALDWAETNLGSKYKAWLRSKTAEMKAELAGTEKFLQTDFVEVSRAQAAKAEELQRALLDDYGDSPENISRLADDLSKYLESDAVIALGMPMHPAVTGFIKSGDLKGALATLASVSPNSQISKVAEKLAAVLEGTKLKTSSIMDQAGKFDPKTNTITLNTESGMNVHTLLHEALHAATSATLANKNHPMTKQLNALFNEVKDLLGTVYGSRSLDEFVAEAQSNPEFRKALGRLLPKTSDVSALRRFVTAIGNFVRRMVGMPIKMPDSVLTRADQMIDAIIAPAPTSRQSGELFLDSTPKGASKIMQSIDNIYKAFPESSQASVKDFTDRASRFLEGTVATKAKQALLSTMPSSVLADYAKRVGIKEGETLHTLMEEQSGAMSKSDTEVDGTLKRLEQWVDKNKAKLDTFNSVVYTSTTEQVDPSLDRKRYEGDKDKLAVWDAMQSEWKSLGAEGQNVYKAMRDSYKKQYLKLKDVIFGKIDETLSDPDERKKLKNTVYARLFETGTIEPYFPLTRDGDFWLSFNAYDAKTKTTEPVVQSFESPAARRRAIAELELDSRVDKKSIQEFVNISQMNYANAPSTSFVGQTLDILKANKVDVETQADVMRLFIESLPESSFAKSLQKRKQTKGYVEDAFGAFRTKAYDLGRQVERLRYSAKLRAVQKALKEGYKPTAENKLVLEELDLRAEFARNPPPDKLARAANRVAFMGTIGLNISSAIVNVSQIPLVVYPMLGGKYGFTEAGAALHEASRLLSNSGFSQKIEMLVPFGKGQKNVKVRAMPSIDNYFELDSSGDYVLRTDINIPKDLQSELMELRTLVRMASDRGQLSRSMYYDTLGAESSGRTRSFTDKVNAWAAFSFHQVERFNRQVTLMTAYKLELQRLKDSKKPEEQGLTTRAREELAANRAMTQAQQTNGGSVLATAPRIAQKGLGRVAMMYKGYGIQMYYTQMQTALRMLKANESDPEVRKAAFRQIAAVQLSSGLLAGVQGLTMYGVLSGLYDLFFTDEDEEDADTIVRKYIGEGWFKGPVNQLTGIDVAGRMGLSNLLYRENPFSKNASNEEWLVQQLGGPAWGVTSQFIRGLQDVRDGELQRGVESMLPAALRNVAKSLRYNTDEAIRTRRGDAIYEDLNTYELIAQAIGFAPADYTLQQEINQDTNRIDKSVNTQRTKLLRQYYIATRMGDLEGTQELRDRMTRFNRKHPTAAITPDSIQRSMKMHAKTSKEMYNGITISQNMRGALAASREEYDQGWNLF